MGGLPATTPAPAKLSIGSILWVVDCLLLHHLRNPASWLDFRGSGLPSAATTPPPANSSVRAQFRGWWTASCCLHSTTCEIEHPGLISRVLDCFLLPLPPPPAKSSIQARFRGWQTPFCHHHSTTCESECLGLILWVVESLSLPSITTTPEIRLLHLISWVVVPFCCHHLHHPRNQVFVLDFRGEGSGTPFFCHHPRIRIFALDFRGGGLPFAASATTTYRLPL